MHLLKSLEDWNEIAFEEIGKAVFLLDWFERKDRVDCGEFLFVVVIPNHDLSQNIRSLLNLLSLWFLYLLNFNWFLELRLLLFLGFLQWLFFLGLNFRSWFYFLHFGYNFVAIVFGFIDDRLSFIGLTFIFGYWADRSGVFLFDLNLLTCDSKTHLFILYNTKNTELYIFIKVFSVRIHIIVYFGLKDRYLFLNWMIYQKIIFFLINYAREKLTEWSLEEQCWVWESKQREEGFQEDRKLHWVGWSSGKWWIFDSIGS